MNTYFKAIDITFPMHECPNLKDNDTKSSTKKETNVNTSRRHPVNDKQSTQWAFNGHICIIKDFLSSDSIFNDKKHMIQSL